MGKCIILIQTQTSDIYLISHYEVFLGSKAYNLSQAQN